MREAETAVITSRESAWTLSWWLKVCFTLGIYLLVWANNRLVVTKQRVYLRKGLLSRSEKNIPMGRIQDVAIHQSVWGRMFDYGTIRIESGSGGAQTEIAVKGFSKPQAIRKALLGLTGGAE